MKDIDNYNETRDFPALDATSGLSVHLRFGTVSVRECFRKAIDRNSEGARTWISELIWREFYQMILDRFPHVKREAFKREYNDLQWEGTEAQFAAWREGRTGYPLVDAAMRHFNRTGWMHNRLRMVVAMFLTKDLLVDWRKGERYFARYLLDYDAAANNGGWQWCASTGVDAQPYFRVFNPILQSKKFDPDGAFIREHVPELRGFSNARIHWPVDASPVEQADAGCIIGTDYPAPIVEHAAQKEKAVAMFQR
jgi:deoxyribodipyrimidine photo-lyase